MTEYNDLTPELISQLQATSARKIATLAENISEDYSHDEMPIYGTKMPEAVCFPSDTEEVAAHHEAVQREQDSRYGSWCRHWPGWR